MEKIKTKRQREEIIHPDEQIDSKIDGQIYCQDKNDRDRRRE